VYLCGLLTPTLETAPPQLVAERRAQRVAALGIDGERPAAEYRDGSSPPPPALVSLAYDALADVRRVVQRRHADAIDATGAELSSTTLAACVALMEADEKPTARAADEVFFCVCVCVCLLRRVCRFNSFCD
jgi:hypothetical protein